MNFHLSAANLIGNLVFGSIGFVAFIYGKKTDSPKPLVIGIALMGYPWFVQNDVWLYIVGAALTAALFLFRD